MLRIFVTVAVLLGSHAFAAMVATAPADEPLRDQIDRLIAAGWRERQIAPAASADDGVFSRRVHLDLCGTIPTADEAKAFLDDASPDKRSKLIDRLLDDPRYARHQADVWDMLFFGRRPPGYYAARRPGFQRWLLDEFAHNVTYDRMVRALLMAEGNTAEQGSPMFLVQYQNQPEDAAVKITQTFLGVQLQCARCHDHPYEPWKQLDFYGVAAFLARLNVVEVGDKSGEKMVAVGEKNLGEIQFTGPASKSEPGQKGEPVAPKFLQGDVLAEPEAPKDLKEEPFQNGKAPPAPRFSRKAALAEWIARADNPYFARAAANRVWAQFMGRGLVHPCDNMSDSNPPTHPELLDELTRRLVEHQFDLKWFIRELVHSKTYQIASTGPVSDELPKWFERARTRPLSAEELVEAWRVATNYAEVNVKTREQLEKGDRFYPVGEYQVVFLGQPTDGAGNFLGGMQEHLFMNNGGIDRLFNAGPGGLTHALAEGPEPWEAKVERLFLSVLSRWPAPEETARFVEFLALDERRHERVQEAMWVLMTCSEFRFNH